MGAVRSSGSPRSSRRSRTASCKRRRVERVAHLVRQAGRQRPDGGQPLGAQRAAQHLLLARHVDARPRRPAARRPLPGTSARLQRTLRTPPPLTGRSCGRPSAATSARPSVPSISARLKAGHLLEQAVPGRDAPVTVQRDDERRHRFDQLAVAALGPLQIQAQPFALVVEPRLIQRPANGVQQVGRRHRLQHVGERVAAHGGDRAFQRRVSGHQDQLHVRRTRRAAAPAATCRRRRAAGRRSARRRSRAPPRSPARTCGRARWPSPRPVSRRSPRRFRPAPLRRRRSGRRSCGRQPRRRAALSSRNMAPPLRDAGSSSMVPPCASRMRRHSARPRPAPLGLGREQRLEEPRAGFGGTPGPSSRTRT